MCGGELKAPVCVQHASIYLSSLPAELQGPAGVGAVQDDWHRILQRRGAEAGSTVFPMRCHH
jgi:hypothetical protein